MTAISLHTPTQLIHLRQNFIRRFLREKNLLPPSLGKKEVDKRPPKPPTRPTMPPSVDAVILDAYCRRLHSGPNPTHMPFSWDSPVDHPWNRAVIQLLATQFKMDVKDCRYQKMTSHQEFGGIQRRLDKGISAIKSVSFCSRLIDCR